MRSADQAHGKQSYDDQSGGNYLFSFQFICLYPGQDARHTAYINITPVKGLTRAMTESDSGKWVPIMGFECRGMDPIRLHPEASSPAIPELCKAWPSMLAANMIEGSRTGLRSRARRAKSSMTWTSATTGWSMMRSWGSLWACMSWSGSLRCTEGDAFCGSRTILHCGVFVTGLVVCTSELIPTPIYEHSWSIR